MQTYKIFCDFGVYVGGEDPNTILMLYHSRSFKTAEFLLFIKDFRKIFVNIRIDCFWILMKQKFFKDAFLKGATFYLYSGGHMMGDYPEYPDAVINKEKVAEILNSPNAREFRNQIKALTNPEAQKFRAVQSALNYLCALYFIEERCIDKGLPPLTMCKVIEIEEGRNDIALQEKLTTDQKVVFDNDNGLCYLKQ